MKYFLYIASFILLDVLTPRIGGCSCSRHTEVEETVTEKQLTEDIANEQISPVNDDELMPSTSISEE